MEERRERALGLASGLTPTPTNIERVAVATDPEAAAWAFTQCSLRESARAKFERAESMLFVREALEQATHERVAAYHASRFPEGALVADLTCGVGSDLIALAARGPVVGYEFDQERAACAEFNLAAHGRSGRVLAEDSLTAEWPFEFAFADPARRVEGRRTLDPSEFSPDPVVLANRMAALRLGGIKLSPLMRDDFLELLGTRLEFVSFGGECREALVWLGAEAIPGRFAVHVEGGQALEAGPGGDQAKDPGKYVFEADPAAIRAHCLGRLCQDFALAMLGDSNGYLTGDGPADSPWLRSYQVLGSGTWEIKAIRRALNDLRAATPVVKQRGAGLDVDDVRRKLRGDGPRPVALAVWPVARSLRYALLEDLTAR